MQKETVTTYHTGELTSVETAREVYKIVRDMKPTLGAAK